MRCSGNDRTVADLTIIMNDPLGGIHTSCDHTSGSAGSKFWSPKGEHLYPGIQEESHWTISCSSYQRPLGVLCQQ